MSAVFCDVPFDEDAEVVLEEDAAAEDVVCPAFEEDDEACVSEDEDAPEFTEEDLSFAAELEAEDMALLKEARELELPPFDAPQPVKVSVSAAAKERNSA